jgi:predicted molibdopterin-dependent oxidoreductase YjgC
MNNEPVYGTERTICPRCAVGCSLRYDEQIGRPTGVEGAPVNREGSLCSKGVGAFDGLREGRLTHPLIRVDGDLEPASWEAAYDRIEAGLGGVVREHSPDTLAFLGAPRCTNEENYLLQKIARCVGTNNVDNRARTCHDAAASAMEDRLGSGGMTNSLDDLSEADVFLVLGANPAERQPVAFNSTVRPAVNDGATLIHIDPRANRTTQMATHHLAPHPGYDALVVALFVRAILDAELEDQSFIEERTTDFDSFARSIGRFAVETDAERAGLDFREVREVAEAFGEAERAAVIVGTGVEDENGATANALLDLLLLTGNLGKRGTGMNLFRGLANEQGASDMGARPDALPGEASVTDADARARTAAEWGVEPPVEPGASEPDLLRAFGDGVRGAFVLGENPAVNRLDAETSEQKFAGLDFLVLQDIMPNETTAYADVVLPASAWTEKSGTVTNLDRQVQFIRPTASSPGRARHDFDVLCALGNRLTDVGFNYDEPADVFAEMTRVNPHYAGMTYREIRDGGQRWPLPEGESEGTQVLHRTKFLTGERRTPFESIAVTTSEAKSDSEKSGRLVLLTESRATESTDKQDKTLHLHPVDADVRGIEDGNSVAVESDHGRAVLHARPSEDVRRGTVFAHATVVDPLVGGGRTTVRVENVRG